MEIKHPFSVLGICLGGLLFLCFVGSKTRPTSSLKQVSKRAMIRAKQSIQQKHSNPTAALMELSGSLRELNMLESIVTPTFILRQTGKDPRDTRGLLMKRLREEAARLDMPSEEARHTTL